MVQFVIVDESDKEYEVKGYVGQNLMSSGLDANVPFEVACGGNAECCTCHVYLNLHIMQDQAYEDADEREMDALDWTEGTTDESRLACQCKISPHFDGQRIRLVALD